MTALNPTAKATLKAADVTQAEWARARQPGLIAISGDLLRLDGTPTHRRNHRGRFAVLPLADLTVDEG